MMIQLSSMLLTIMMFLPTSQSWRNPSSKITKPDPVTRHSVAPTRPSVESITKTWDRDAWLHGFETARTEEAYEVTGASIPADLEGTLFRNGHAKFDVNGVKIAHPFDGDGMISAITFKDGCAFFRNRFVRTTGFKQEAKAKKILYRGTFGTQKEGGMLGNIFDLRRKNVANTNVIYWGENLLALWEGGLPHLMDPKTLATAGESRVGGVLKRNTNFGAHPRYDKKNDRYVFFSTAPDPRSSKITCYEFDNKFKLVSQRTELVPGFSLLHDMVITDRYYIFFQAPLTLNPTKWILGLAGVASGIKFQEDQPAFSILIPRDVEDKNVVRIPVDPHFSFHFGNAYDEGEEVVVDIIRAPKLYLADEKGSSELPVWEAVNYETEVPKSTLWRYRLNPREMSHSKEETLRGYCDFPSINPSKSGQKHRYLYLASGRDPTYPTPVGVVTKFDCETRQVDEWRAQPYEFISESVVVPKKGGGEEEDDVYLMTYVFNGQTQLSECLIFDAKKISKGPISRLPLKSNIPLSLHGSWTTATWDGDEILRQYKVNAALEKNNWNEVNSGMAPIIDF